VSVYPLGAVWHESHAIGAAFIVLLAIADEANDDGLCSAYNRSRAHLAKKCRLSERSVQRAVRDLVELGELRVLERGKGNQQSSYQVVLAGFPRGDSVAPRGRQRGSSGETLSLLGGDTVAPPIKEPVITRSSRSTRGAKRDKAGPNFEAAHALAREEWESRSRKPVCGFPAFALRIEESLDAGATEEQLRKVLPTMTVFSRNAFDFALGGSGKRVRKAPVDDSAQRAAPAGKVEL
jgi:hypothetical protein